MRRDLWNVTREINPERHMWGLEGLLNILKLLIMSFGKF